MMMQWKPDDQYDEDSTAQPGYQEPPEPHPIRNSILGVLFFAIMVLLAIGTIWIVFLMGIGK